MGIWVENLPSEICIFWDFFYHKAKCSQVEVNANHKKGFLVALHVVVRFRMLAALNTCQFCVNIDLRTQFGCIGRWCVGIIGNSSYLFQSWRWADELISCLEWNRNDCSLLLFKYQLEVLEWS